MVVLAAAAAAAAAVVVYDGVVFVVEKTKKKNLGSNKNHGLSIQHSQAIPTESMQQQP